MYTVVNDIKVHAKSMSEVVQCQDILIRLITTSVTECIYSPNDQRQRDMYNSSYNIYKNARIRLVKSRLTVINSYTTLLKSIVYPIIPVDEVADIVIAYRGEHFSNLEFCTCKIRV